MISREKLEELRKSKKDHVEPCPANICNHAATACGYFTEMLDTIETLYTRNETLEGRMKLLEQYDHSAAVVVNDKKTRDYIAKLEAALKRIKLEYMDGCDCSEIAKAALEETKP